MLTLEGYDQGFKELSRTLIVLEDGLDDWDKPFSDLGTELVQVWDLNFAGEGSLFGGWEPAAMDYGHPLLQDTGDMRGAFGFGATKDTLELYNTDPKFRFHQSREPRSKLPRRVMMMLDEERKQLVQKRFQEYIVNLIRGKR